MPAFRQRAPAIPAPLTSPSRLPIVALASVVLLIAAGWLFFLATYELAKVNYERKGGAEGYKTARAHETGRR